MPDSTRWTDQDIPLDELSSGSLNADSLFMLERMKAEFNPYDTLIEGKPISMFLSRADISQDAKDFYNLKFIPYHDFYNRNSFIVDALCDSLLTKNDTTRAFYYFLFLRFQKIAKDAELDGEIDSYGKEYAMTFVDEFYKRLNNPFYRSSYSNWVDEVANAVPNVSSDEYKEMIVKEQIKHAKKVTPELRKEIQVFADSVSSRIKD